MNVETRNSLCMAVILVIIALCVVRVAYVMAARQESKPNDPYAAPANR